MSLYTLTDPIVRIDVPHRFIEMKGRAALDDKASVLGDEVAVSSDNADAYQDDSDEYGKCFHGELLFPVSALSGIFS
ncbi:MAG TPA: hypothetical protein PLI79_20655 [Mycobacterium sp.]|nr:hypothetical protein [Mycobacterium sp.]